MLRNAVLDEIAGFRRAGKTARPRRIFAEGLRLVEEALSSSCEVDLIIASDSWAEKNMALPPPFLAGRTIEIIPDRKFDKLCETKHPQGLGCVVNLPAGRPLEEEEPCPLILYFDRIQDPGNAGSLIRTARWFGLTDIIISPDTVDVYNDKVVRGSMGGVFYSRFYYDSPDGALLQAAARRGYEIVAADMDGEDAFRFFAGSAKCVLALSNEANGLSREVNALKHRSIAIPCTGSGESLNVAAAGAIIIALLSRGR